MNGLPALRRTDFTFSPCKPRTSPPTRSDAYMDLEQHGRCRCIRWQQAHDVLGAR